MRVFKGIDFDDWAAINQISDESLLKTLDEIAGGLIDANLGSGLLKKEGSTLWARKTRWCQNNISF